MKLVIIAAIAVPVLSLAALAGPGYRTAPTVSATASVTAAAAEKYTCPMHPEVTSDKPGKCPKCGMKLVPAKS